VRTIKNTQIYFVERIQSFRCLSGWYLYNHWGVNANTQYNLEKNINSYNYVSPNLASKGSWKTVQDLLPRIKVHTSGGYITGASRS
jgi:hypothetical protein